MFNRAFHRIAVTEAFFLVSLGLAHQVFPGELSRDKDMSVFLGPDRAGQARQTEYLFLTALAEKLFYASKPLDSEKETSGRARKQVFSKKPF